MAERRMFAKSIIDSDVFLEMPQSTQNLYFHLSMRADDDGFINNPKKIMRMVGCGDDDLRILLAKRYLLGFESGVVVIKHWRIHNYIQKDRYKPTMYIEEANSLTTKENGAYTECIQDVHEKSVLCTPRFGKVRIGKSKVSKGKSIVKDNPPTIEEIEAYVQEKCQSVSAQSFLDYYTELDWNDKEGKPVVNWKLKMQQWHKREIDRGWKPPEPEKQIIKHTCEHCGAVYTDFCRNPDCPGYA